MTKEKKKFRYEKPLLNNLDLVADGLPACSSPGASATAACSSNGGAATSACTEGGGN